MSETLVYLPIWELHEHPDNPRKDIGDIAELTESIRLNGIMQNLTVVRGHRMTDEEWRKLLAQYSANPDEETREAMNSRWSDEGYTIVIGHRRFNAAKAAGLKTLPCIISKMDYAKQLETMLVENMQRSDLTVYEQAKGFQQLTMQGYSTAQIAEKSGFSAATVKKRLEIAKLDGEALNRVTKHRQISIADFDELQKVESIERRNELLKDIGTANFRAKVNEAVDDEAWLKKIPEILKTIKTFAEQITEEEAKSGDYEPVVWISQYSHQNRDYTVPERAKERKYFYTFSEKEKKYPITLYNRSQDIKEDPARLEREIKGRRENALRAKLNDINRRHYQLRKEFVEGFDFSAADCEKKIHAFLLDALLMCAEENLRIDVLCEEEDFADLFGVEEFEVAASKIRSGKYDAKKTDLFMAFSILNCERSGYWQFRWTSNSYEYVADYFPNERLDCVYKHLVNLGYEMSDEEKMMQSNECPYLQKDFDMATLDAEARDKSVE